ncbi:MAG: zinc ABC transporter substrate-binding protein [Deltaproteobacteria bacterium]|nr:zinc ABC transporter substrate-binding protein [Deltaproteobacteria bacterium]
MKARRQLIGLVLLMLTSGCEQHQPSAAGQSKLVVFVSVLPQAFLVERIGGQQVRVEVLVRPGQSPATYEPSPRQMAELGQASLYVRVGAPFERGVLDEIRKTYPGLELLDAREGLVLIDKSGRPIAPGAPPDSADHHVWLDPGRLAIQAEHIARALERLDPSHAEIYRSRLGSLRAEMQALDARISERLAPLKGRSFLVYHPAYGYFAEAYGLRQSAVELDGKQPQARHLAALIDRAKASRARVIFVQPQFSSKSAALAAEAIGAAVRPLDPLAGDVLANLEHMAESIAAALEE